MKIYEIREMKTEEILQRIAEEEKNLVDLRFSHQLKQLTNTARLKLVKKNIAKMRTVIRERERESLKAKAIEKKKEGVNE